MSVLLVVFAYSTPVGVLTWLLRAGGPYFRGAVRCKGQGSAYVCLDHFRPRLARPYTPSLLHAYLLNPKILPSNLRSYPRTLPPTLTPFLPPSNLPSYPQTFPPTCKPSLLPSNLPSYLQKPHSYPHVEARHLHKMHFSYEHTLRLTFLLHCPVA